MNKTISYFTIAVRRHHDEGSLWKSVLGAYDFRVVEHMTVKAWSMAAGRWASEEEVAKMSHLKTQPKDSVSQQRESFESSKCSLSNAPPLEAIPSNPFQVFPLTEDQALKYLAAVVIQTITVSIPYEQQSTVG